MINHREPLTDFLNTFKGNIFLVKDEPKNFLVADSSNVVLGSETVIVDKANNRCFVGVSLSFTPYDGGGVVVKLGPADVPQGYDKRQAEASDLAAS